MLASKYVYLFKMVVWRFKCQTTILNILTTYSYAIHISLLLR